MIGLDEGVVTGVKDLQRHAGPALPLALDAAAGGGARASRQSIPESRSSRDAAAPCRRRRGDRGCLAGVSDDSASTSGSRLSLEAYARPRSVLADRSQSLDAEERRSLARLVLDGILEIETDQGFVSGLDAVPRLFSTPLPCVGDTVSEPSRGALEYALALLPIETSQLATRLYLYGSLPASPRWFARVPDAAAIAEYVRLDDLIHHPAFAGRVGARCASRLPESGSSFDAAKSRTRQQAPHPRRIHKMYVGVVPSEPPRILPAVADRCSARTPSPSRSPGVLGVFAVRTNSSCTSRTRESLERASDSMVGCLSTAAAHHVPFAEPCPRSQRIWWSSDRAFDNDAPASASGRYDVCAQLAHSFAVATRAREPSTLAIDLALLRLELDGWDVATFANAEWRAS